MNNFNTISGHTSAGCTITNSGTGKTATTSCAVRYSPHLSQQ